MAFYFQKKIGLPFLFSCSEEKCYTYTNTPMNIKSLHYDDCVYLQKWRFPMCKVKSKVHYKSALHDVIIVLHRTISQLYERN